ncbi:acyl-CoA dehydrogenase family protein [Haliea sp.]
MDFNLTSEQERLIGLAAELGREKFAKRAAQYDRDAEFPMENYNDLRDAGLLKLCVPKEHGGLGADYQTYMLVAAEIARHCAATALTFNMHSCAMMWNAQMIHDFPISDQQRAEHETLKLRHFARVVDEGKIYSQPFSETGDNWMAKPFSTRAVRGKDGWHITGKKVFASLSGAADYYGIVCTEVADDGELYFDNTLYVAMSKDSPGFSITGSWDPLGMRGTVSRTLVLDNVFVPYEEAIMPKGAYYHGQIVWPHMYMTLTPAYLGTAQAAYDFTRAYLRGEIEGMPPVKRRAFPSKQAAVAEMYIKLQQAWAVFNRAISDAKGNPGPEDIMRLYVCQYTVMEYSNDICRLAIRTCGGQSMLRSLPLERYYRDSRCGSLMLPYTAEICTTFLGISCLYDEGEELEAPPPLPPKAVASKQ